MAKLVVQEADQFDFIFSCLRVGLREAVGVAATLWFYIVENVHIGHLFKLDLGQQSIQVNFAIVDLRNYRITVFLVDDLFGIN